MKMILKRGLALFLSIAVVALCAFSACASEDASPFTFKVSSDGYAVIADCDANANGIVIIPQSVTVGDKTYAVKYIGEKAFDSCYSISEIHIPEGVTAIKNYAFRDCVSLKNIYIPESLVMCQYDAFEGCGKLTVHCYTSNYQFFSIYGISANIDVVVIDGDEYGDNNTDNGSNDAEEDIFSDNFITRIIEAIRNLINNIMEYFDANDDFEFPFASEFPFIDDLINEFEKM